MTESELNRILDSHRRWLISDGKEGTRADLSGKNLCKFDLSDADLRRADLSGADLSHARLIAARLKGANLQEANLRGADLTSADLSGSDLTGTILCDAVLREADLTDVHGLQEHFLAGADLSHVRLPVSQVDFTGLNEAAGITVQARIVHALVIAGCALSWLTIASTSDLALIRDSPPTALPLLQARISIADFFRAAPAILLALYAYFHLYIQNLWTVTADLPAVFPDGKPLDRKTPPWLFLCLARAHVPLIRSDRPPYSRLQVLISIVSGWLLVPGTILLFWFCYLTRHDWPWTVFLCFLLAVSAGLGFDSYRLARRKLRGHGRADRRHSHNTYRSMPVRLRRVLSRGLGAALPAGVLLALCLWVSFQVIHGVLEPKEQESASRLYRATVILRTYTRADLRDQAVSQRDLHWTSAYKAWVESGCQGDPPRITGARLDGRNLRYALLDNAFLAGIQLDRADLVGARLVGADLRTAKLRNADFSRARLSKADLRDADIWGARLRGANLRAADLRRARLWQADLRVADLRKADFSGALLWDVKLLEANAEAAVFENAMLVWARGLETVFKNARFHGADLTSARFMQADLTSADLTNAKLCSAWLEKADLGRAKLANTDLMEADLRGANLSGANLEEANLWGARIQGANLRTATNLTQDQLDEACCDDHTALPSNLDAEICRQNGAIIKSQ